MAECSMTDLFCDACGKSLTIKDSVRIRFTIQESVKKLDKRLSLLCNDGIYCIECSEKFVGFAIHSEVEKIEKLEKEKEIRRRKEICDYTRSTEINFLDLSVRTYNSLFRNGYKTLGNILDTPEREFRESKNLSNNSIKEVMEVKRIFAYLLEDQIE